MKADGSLAGRRLPPRGMGGEDHRYPPQGRAWWGVAVFCVAALVSYTDRLILSALVDPIKDTLALSDSQISLLQGAAFAVVYVFAGLMLGRLADKRHRITILVCGATVWCIGTAVSGISTSFAALFVSRVVVGIGEASLAPAAVSIIADSIPPHRRGMAVGIFLLGTVLGGPVSISVGSLMLAAANSGAFSGLPFLGSLVPWRRVLVIVGVSGLVVPILFLTMNEPSRRQLVQAPALRDTIARLSADRRRLIPAYLAMGLMSIGDYGLLSWMPSVLSRRFAMAPEAVGWTFGVITVVTGVLGCLLGGVGSDVAARWRSTRGRLVYSTLAAIAAALGALLVSSSNLTGVLVGLALWTLASATAAISGIAAIQDIVPNADRGVGMALVAFCNTLLGLGFGPTLVAVVTERVYADPVSVGIAITTVVFPASVLAVGLFAHSCRMVTPIKRAIAI